MPTESETERPAEDEAASERATGSAAKADGALKPRIALPGEYIDTAFGRMTPLGARILEQARAWEEDQLKEADEYAAIRDKAKEAVFSIMYLTEYVQVYMEDLYNAIYDTLAATSTEPIISPIKTLTKLTNILTAAAKTDSKLSS